MDATTEEIKNFCADGESIPSASILLALSDAKVFLRKYGISETNEDYSIFHRYYTLHLLFMRGFDQVLTGFGIGDHSQQFQAANVGNKEGNSPALIEFNKLLGMGNNFPMAP